MVELHLRYTQCPIPYTLHAIPYTLYPIPYTLYPIFTTMTIPTLTLPPQPGSDPAAYYLAAYGTAACPSGEAILSSAVCQVAYAALASGLPTPTREIWEGAAGDIPAQCSFMGSAGPWVGLHFNSGSGSPRADLAPVCATSTTAGALCAVLSYTLWGEGGTVYMTDGLYDVTKECHLTAVPQWYARLSCPLSCPLSCSLSCPATSDPDPSPCQQAWPIASRPP